MKDLLASKKFKMVLLGTLVEALFVGVTLAAQALATGELNPETTALLAQLSEAKVTIQALLGVGVVGQGIADHGKERAKVEARAMEGAGAFGTTGGTP